MGGRAGDGDGDGSGDGAEDRAKEEKEKALRERVRERLKARAAAAPGSGTRPSSGGGSGGGSSSKRDRDRDRAEEDERDRAKRRKREKEAERSSGGGSSGGYRKMGPGAEISGAELDVWKKRAEEVKKEKAAKKEEEAAEKLGIDMVERKKRVEEWQEKRRKEKADAEVAAAATTAATHYQVKETEALDGGSRPRPRAPRAGGTWSLDDDLGGIASGSDDDQPQDDGGGGNSSPLANAGTGTGARAMDADDDEEDDPLEAFMMTNDTVMDAERAGAKVARAEKEAAAVKKKEDRAAAAVTADVAADFMAAAAQAAKAAAAATAAAVAAGAAADPGGSVLVKQEAEAEGAVVAGAAGEGGNPSAGGLPPSVVKKEEEEEVDPFDAFMATNKANAAGAIGEREVKMETEAAKPAGPAKVLLMKKPNSSGFLKGLVIKKPGASKLRPAVPRSGAAGGGRGARKIGVVRRVFDINSDSNAESSSDGEADVDSASDDDDEWARKQSSKMSKADKLGLTDHDAVEYPTFRKNFYIESYEIARLSKDETRDLRAELEGIKCRGKEVPKPIKNWAQAGLSNRVMELIRRSGFDKPMPIQCQALPVIMSGRDCIGVAKTGSGKTLSYVLPMLRHIKDQPATQQGDGPVGMIMGPTRELVTQIGKDCKKFGRAVGLVAVSVYGGSGVAAQIGELKRGCEIVACTPGRMIDLLTTGAGRITNLRRVTYMVLDEADRMFDMGFEPQITRIMNNLRPDRQTVMFSATFPPAMEALARLALNNPVEIQVGGRSVVNSDIEQVVEMRPEEDRFLRMLELLGEWYEQGKILIFVASQDKCDQVFRDLLRSGYPCLSLHGGKEQTDRECTIADFKSDVCNILIATSVAARGLDVKVSEVNPSLKETPANAPLDIPNR
jgi:ATP-dependent RNA helicase DDX46/PRP5